MFFLDENLNRLYITFTWIGCRIQGWFTTNTRSKSFKSIKPATAGVGSPMFEIFQRASFGFLNRIWKHAHVRSGGAYLGQCSIARADLTPALTYRSVWCYSQVYFRTAFILVLGLTDWALDFICFYPLYQAFYIEKLYQIKYE